MRFIKVFPNDAIHVNCNHVVTGELCLSDTPTSNVGTAIRPQTCLCKSQCSAAAGDRCCHSTTTSCTCSQRQVTNRSTSDVKRRFWRPLLLIVPMRLGLSEINPIYYNAVKVTLLPSFKTVELTCQDFR